MRKDCAVRSVLQITFLLRCDFFFSSRRRHTRLVSDWSSDVCSSDLPPDEVPSHAGQHQDRQGLWQGVTAREVICDPGEETGPQSGMLLDAAVADVIEGLQIGRASGRERGESSGGAGRLKRKTSERVA